MSLFQDYVTSTAFSLTLSRPMCDAMQYMVGNSIEKKGFRIVGHIPQLMTMHSLERRGLVVHNGRSEKFLCMGWDLTEAGEALYPLLVMAGLCRSADDLRNELEAA